MVSEEDMMATALPSQTLQTAVTHRLSLAHLEIIPTTTNGMDISKILSEAPGREVLGAHLEVAEGPQDLAEECHK